MPELPEVEIVRRGLEGAVRGKKIKRVQLNRPNLRFAIPDNFQQILEGQVIDSLSRRGKYILVFLDDGNGFVLHLGMSGVVKIIPAGDGYQPEKHDHIVMDFEDGGCVVYHDPRRFGFVDLITRDGWAAYSSFAGMGPEPLSNAFSAEVLFEALQRKAAPIKTALLDQKVVAGLGNIYVCEALFMAGIHPIRPANKVLREEAEVLSRCIKEVLMKAIESGGSSLKDYYHTDGSLGYFQHSFAVYDRVGRVCPKCEVARREAGCVERIVQGGRSTFFCAFQQK